MTQAETSWTWFPTEAKVGPPPSPRDLFLLQQEHFRNVERAELFRREAQGYTDRKHFRMLFSRSWRHAVRYFLYRLALMV